MEAVLGTLAAVLVVVGVMMMLPKRRRPRCRLRDRNDGERLGVRIEQAIEQLRRKS